MRTCMAFHVRLHLIEPLGFSLDEKHLRRAGMDYRNQIEMHIYKDWNTFKEGREGSFYYVTRYGFKTPDAFDYRKDYEDGKDIYLVFGKESTGIDKEILYQNEDRCIRIPMVKEARSLNLSNCAALCVYEVLRQLGYPDLSNEEVIKGAHFLDEVHNNRQ